jgi:hypothetical protein
MVSKLQHEPHHGRIRHSGVEGLLTGVQAGSGIESHSKRRRCTEARTSVL